jgi:hypothetical protein
MRTFKFIEWENGSAVVTRCGDSVEDIKFNPKEFLAEKQLSYSVLGKTYQTGIDGMVHTMMYLPHDHDLMIQE